MALQVDFSTAGAESDAHLHLAPHAHYNHQASSGSPAFAPFRHPVAPSIDPGLDQSQSSARNGHAQLAAHPSASPHLLQADHASINSSHMAHQYYGDLSQRSQTPSTPSNASPRFSALSPAQQKQIVPGFVPNDRSAPSRDVADDTIDDAYAAFILYCNPSFPPSTNTSELTKAFRIPPKSDGKSFSTWSLFELIRKLDLKEIKTWTQLALELGVEPPDMDKGQSTQKVQQYSVRLKRWMRAMHIDAFFEFLLGKQHVYYMQIPPPHNPFPPDGRDAVPLEEDLAIRALDPKFRPKRGRRKTEDPDEELETPDHATPPRKRPQLDTSIPFGNLIGQPQSAYPDSAHPNDDMDRFLSAHDPWTAASAITPASAMTTASAPSRLNPHSRGLTPYTATPMSAGQQLRWRLNTQDNPSTPHPMSATTPQTAHPPDFPFNEPQSATTPSSAKSRSRRRHGPAVSSAWPSNSTSASGKLRGRPPSNRSVRDGPFVTFPANPNTKEAPTIDMNRNTGGLTPIVERAHSDPPEHHFRFPPATPASAVSTQSMQEQSTNPQGRPSRLQVQVPPHVGGPVRLVTPTLLVNGEQDPTPSTGLPPSALSTTSRRGSDNFFEDDNEDDVDRSMFPPSSTQASRTSQDIHRQAQQQHTSAAQPAQTHSDSPIANLTHETLNRALAADLLRAPLTGRRKRLRGTEAKHLANAILQNLYASHTPASTSHSSRPMSDNALRFSIASSLGLCAQAGLGAGGPQGGVKNVVVQRFRVGGDGYDSPVDEEDEEESPSGGRIRETWDVFFQVNFGAMSGEFSIKSLEIEITETGVEGGQASGGAEPMDIEGREDWKTRFEEAQRRLGEAREEVGRLRDKVLDAVL